MSVTSVLALCVVLCGAPEVPSQPVVDLTTLAALNFELHPADLLPANLGLLQAAPAEAPAASTQPRSAAFGSEGSTYWIINAGYGSDFGDADMGKVGGGISYFIVDDFSLDFELAFIGFADDGDTAAGANLNLLMRWHFLHNQPNTWSLYVDGGAGLLVTNKNEPRTGSTFNFTPQLGVGVSFDLNPSLRFYTGVRWHHVSNARLYESNPARDSAFIYAMVSFPF